MKHERWTALDLLRSLAVVMMVQGHVFHVALTDAQKRAPWYEWHSLVHGLTAPAFLTGAGLAFGLTTFRAWDAHAVPGAGLRKRLVRYVWLVALGYALQFPSMSLARALAPANIAAALSFGPLQLVGVVLSVVELSVVVLRTRARVVAFVATLGATLSVLAPVVARLPIERFVPLAVVAAVDDRTGSTFPLLPWAVFVCAGVLLAHAVCDARGALVPGAHLRLGAGGAALAVGSYLVFLAPFQVIPRHDFWATSPVYVAFRLGVVLLVLSALGGVARAVERRGPSPWLARIAVLGRESLVVYVVHLLVLFGSPLWHSLRFYVGGKLGPVDATLVAALLVAASAAAAYAWQALAKHRTAGFDVLRTGLAGALAYFVLLQS